MNHRSAGIHVERFEPRQRRVVRDEWGAPYSDPIDDTLDDSFPASDPPSWNLGTRDPAPRSLRQPSGRPDL